MDTTTIFTDQELYQRLFESSQDPMWMIVKDKFVVANESAAKLSVMIQYTACLTRTHQNSHRNIKKMV